MLRLAMSEARTGRGALIIAAAVSIAYWMISNATAALYIGVAGLASGLVVALALGGRQRRRNRPVEKSVSALVSPAEVEDPRVESVRQRLRDLASRLDLTPVDQPGSPPAGSFEPLTSIIVPCYNDAGFVAAALESIRRQSYGSWECLIIDDASTDRSRDIIEREVGDDPRFRTFLLERNQGSGAARNLGINEAAGDYVVFLDADDLLLRESLRDRVGALAPRADDPYVAGSFCAVDFRPEDVELDSLPHSRKVAQKSLIDFLAAEGECPFTINAPLVSVERLRAVGGFDESMTTGAVDWDLWYRMLRNGYVFVPSGTLGAVYRQKGGGITRSNKPGHTKASARLIWAANRRAEPGIITDPSPFPMTDPLGDYRARLAVSERATRFASMALAEGDVQAMTETLRVLEGESWTFVDRHLDWSDTVRRGAARVLGLRPQQMEQFRDELLPLIAAVRNTTEEICS